MKPNKNDTSSFEHLLQCDEPTVHAFRQFLNLAHPRVKPSWGESGVGDFGVWTMVKNEGQTDWQVKPNLTIREKHSWTVRPLSSGNEPSRNESSRQRVVLVGSSAAASFGYWGDFTLASAIEHQLNALAGETQYEVIDLACVNALFSLSRQALHHAQSLRPDIVIIYEGNNEAKTLINRLRDRQLFHLPGAARAQFVETLDSVAGLAALNQCYQQHMALEAEAVAAFAKHSSIETYVVIPQYNLADWRGPQRLPQALGGDKLSQWYVKLSQAEQYLQQQQFELALSTFDELVQLDGGACQRTAFGRAQSLTGLGRDDLAADAYEQARDAGFGPFVKGDPQVTAGSIEAMREVYNQHQIPYVDLPELFARQGTCGRDYFLDYCHLNVAGIRLLAGALVDKILTTTNKGNVEAVQSAMLLAQKPISDKEAGLGSWVAAIHNYHNGQADELVLYWLRDALDKWPSLDSLLSFLADHLCDPWRERFTLAWFKQQGFFDLLGERTFFFFAKFFYHARFDHQLVAIIDELRGVSRAKRMAQWQEGLGDVMGDLGGKLYSLFFMDMRKGFVTSDRTAPRGGWEKRCLDIDACEPISTIDFPLATVADHQLEIALSGVDLAHCQAQQTHCCVDINGEGVSSFDVLADWQQLVIEIPGSLLSVGINTLTFSWDGLVSMADLARPCERTAYFEQYGFYPVAARIHLLTLSKQATDDD